MTGLPPEFSLLASLVDAQPAPVHEAFRYCLAPAMVEAGKHLPRRRQGARLVGQEPGEAGRCAPSRRRPASYPA
jgi:hypothetical protein